MKKLLLFLSLTAIISCKNCYDCSVKTIENRIDTVGFTSDQIIILSDPTELCDEDLVQFKKETNSRKRDTLLINVGYLETIYSYDCNKI